MSSECFCMVSRSPEKEKNRTKQKFHTSRILVSCWSASRKKVKVGSYLLFCAVCCPVNELSYIRKRFYDY